MSFFTELKRRNVFKVGVAYAIVAWLLIQVADILLPTFQAPDWVMRVFALFVILGFPLAVFLAWAYELTPEGIKVTTSEGPAQYHTRTTGQRLNYFIMGVLVLAVVFLFIDKYFLTTEQEITVQETIQPAVKEDKRSVLPNSIAVLPFENLSADQTHAYFAAGIHDSILHELAKIGALNVIARTTMLRYAGTSRSIGEIAGELNVETVMEGTVQYADDQVRITAQLINPATGAHLWSGNYDKPFKDIFSIQSEIATRIAQALEAELLPDERESLNRIPTESNAAHALYLKARSLIANMYPAMPTPFYSLLHDAVRQDRDFALAHATLAFAYARGLGYITSGPLGESLTEVEGVAIEHADTALALDQNQGLAHAALAMVDAAYMRIDAARSHWDKAVEVSPNNLDVLDDAVHFYALAGPKIRVAPLANKVVAIDPISAERVQEFASWASEDFGSVSKIIRERIKIDKAYAASAESHVTLGFYEMVRGNHEVALEELRLGEQLNTFYLNTTSAPSLIYTYGRLGLQHEAERIMERLQASPDYDSFAQDILPTTWVLVYLGVNDEQKALANLSKAVEDPGPTSGSFEERVFLSKNDPVLEQPAFVELRKKLSFE